MQLLSRLILRVRTAPAEAHRAPHRLDDTSADAGPPADCSPRIASAIGAAIAARIEIVMATHRSAYEAAAAYEELSRLCDAELGRRRLARTGIAWQVFKVLTQSK
jgi:hypothetical protein